MNPHWNFRTSSLEGPQRTTTYKTIITRHFMVEILKHFFCFGVLKISKMVWHVFDKKLIFY